MPVKFWTATRESNTQGHLLRTLINVSRGISMFPILFIRFFPSACLFKSFIRRDMSPPYCNNPEEKGEMIIKNQRQACSGMLKEHIHILPSRLFAGLAHFHALQSSLQQRPGLQPRTIGEGLFLSGVNIFLCRIVGLWMHALPCSTLQSPRRSVWCPTTKAKSICTTHSTNWLSRIVTNLDNIWWLEVVLLVIETRVTRRKGFQRVVKVDCNFVKRKLELHHDT